MKRAAVLIFAAAQSSLVLAGSIGSLSFGDINHLVAQKQDAFELIMSSFEVFETGTARMINRAENVKLNGARIGPYSFPLRLKGKDAPFAYNLVIETRIMFLDQKGRVVALEDASDFRQEVIKLCIEPRSKGGYFIPIPDKVEEQRGELERQSRLFVSPSPAPDE